MIKLKLLGAEVLFATREEGRDRVSSSDIYTRSLSPFDLQAKVQRIGCLSEADYLENCRAFVRAWSKDEVVYLREIVRQTDLRLSKLEVHAEMPPEIFLVKTTGWEEGGANGYTRQNNIFLNQSSLSSNLFRHEVFHIISRFNQAIRDASYETVGFKKSSPITYKNDRRISNPDAPSLNHTVTLSFCGVEFEAAIIIISDRDYSGGGFFPYVTKRILPITPPAIDSTPFPETLDFSQARGLLPTIGRNTSYNIHQEEICASHFEFLLSERRSVPDWHMVEALGHVLKAK